MRFGIACHSGFGPKFAKESKKQQKRPHETSWAAAVKHLFHAAQSSKEGGYVGHETNTGCPHPKTKKMS
jgi:hypothetical protein